ncbi:MAG TPA: hypothetical protein IGS53_21360 [Leptolyngbyaceae cyanobacterium M33_DOE_097]|uniref:Uncharacterized protein n=1 Tax=Oscillatoriales cyanobacterium SpSt-418 TaxID=2282169 RepID=A0A7C3PDN1_9CYAN|nr:hypothetical protein [Leptolyngbyaceae cyanobacterium M33_DOE_097]
MQFTTNRSALLTWLLLASLISTAIHFTDNYFFIDHYPQPSWITAPSIYQSWIVLTAIGAIGYWLYRAQRFWLAYPCLAIYSLTGLASPAHYLYGPLSQFSPKMHLFIWTDGLTCLAVLGFVFWSLFLRQEWRTFPKASE